MNRATRRAARMQRTPRAYVFSARVTHGEFFVGEMVVVPGFPVSGRSPLCMGRVTAIDAAAGTITVTAS